MSVSYTHLDVYKRQIDARNAGNRYDLVIAGMVMIGTIGLLLDLGMRSLERVKSFRWSYTED